MIDTLVNLLPGVPEPVSAKLLIRAWDTSGVEMSFPAWREYVEFTTGNLSMIDNYGAYQMGDAPATPQEGTLATPLFINNVQYIASDIPSGVPLYFTALWRAPNIGHVFMRADNAGQGIEVAANGQYFLKLPQAFVHSEYQTLQSQLSSYTPSSEMQAQLSAVAQAVQAFDATAGDSAQALAAYDALALIMPLKEAVVVDSSTQSILAAGLRDDFDMNYEGFGSWTSPENQAMYAEVREAGFTSVYTTVDFLRFIPEPGVYDFSLMEYHVAQAEQQGFKIGFNINRNIEIYPDWVRELEFEELKSLYYDTAYRIVEYFGDRVGWYYPAGELELAVEGRGMQELTELAIASFAGARAAAPDTPMRYYASGSAYVAYQMNQFTPNSPTFYSSLDMLEYMVGNGLEMDFLALQMQYGTTFAPIDIQRFQEVITQYHDVFQVPMYLGETGFSTKTEDYGYPAEASWHDGYTQSAQRDWLNGTLRALYALPFVKSYYWVHVDPDNTDYDSDYLFTLLGTGLVDADGNRKLSLDAVEAFFEAVND